MAQKAAKWPPFVQIVNGWPTIDIGRMRHAIQVRKLAPSSPPVFDASGAQLTAQAVLPAPGDVLMAAVEIVRGVEAFKAGQTTSQLFITVGIWYQPGILASMQVVNDNGAVYVIDSVENILELNVVLLLNCLALGVANDV